MYMLNQIRLFCLDYHDKIVIATGDTKQLPLIEDMNRRIVNDMCADFWVKRLPLEELIKKCFEMADDVKTSDCNIAYTNNRSMGVSKETRTRLGKTGDYEVGEVLVWRLHK